jgi:hypothetical protein
VDDVEARSRGWLLVGAVAAVLVVVALVVAQLTFTADATPREEVRAFLDEAAGSQGRFLTSVVIFAAVAFLVLPVFIALRHELGRQHRVAVDTALAFAVLGAALSAAADATQLAVGAETVARWTDADEGLRSVLSADAASLLWLGDALTNLSRVAFGVAVGCAGLAMVGAGTRVWRTTGVLGLVAAVCSVISAFALAAAGLEVVWLLGLAALLLWFLGSAWGLAEAWRHHRPTPQRTSGAPTARSHAAST